MKESKIQLVREIRKILDEKCVGKNDVYWINGYCGDIAWVNKTRIGHSSTYNSLVYGGYWYDVPLYDKSTTLDELKQIKEAIQANR